MWKRLLQVRWVIQVFQRFLFFSQIKQATVIILNDLGHDVSRKAPSIVSIVKEKPDNSFIP